MKKASMVLGIIGGAISFLAALAIIIFGILLLSINTNFVMDICRSFNVKPFFLTDDIFNLSTSIAGIVLIIWGVINAACGVLGLVGGTMVQKNSTTAGILMIVAAGISLVLSFNWLSMTLFTLGGIFALVKEKPPVAPVQPPVQQ